MISHQTLICRLQAQSTTGWVTHECAARLGHFALMHVHNVKYNTTELRLKKLIEEWNIMIKVRVINKSLLAGLCSNNPFGFGSVIDISLAC